MRADRRPVFRPLLVLLLALAAAPALAQMPPGDVLVLGASVVEGNSDSRPLRFAISLRPSPTAPPTLTLNFRTRDAGATAGSDYTASDGTVTLTRAMPLATVEVAVLGDTTVEPVERIELVVTDPALPLQVVGSGAILDDDAGQPPPPPDLPASVVPLDGIVREPASGDVEGSLSLLRFGPLDAPLSIGFVVAGGSATPGEDYTGPAAGQVDFAAGQRLARLAFQVRADATSEGTETVRATFTAPPMVRLLRPAAALRIVDRSTPVPPPAAVGVIACRPLLHETDGSARFVVRRHGEVDAALAVDYATADLGGPGAATAGTDYTATSGRLEWAAGASDARVVEVPVLPDDAIEPPERFALSLSGAPDGVLVAPARAFAVILDARDNVFTDAFASLCEDPQAAE